VGAGSAKTRRLNAAPVVHDGRVFTIDTMAGVKAFDARSGAALWTARITLKRQAQQIGFGGGVSAANGRVFATTGFGIIAAFDARTGVELWQTNLNTPLRGAPTVAGNRLFVLSNDNQLFELSVETGEQAWSVTGTVEVAGLLGIGAPAVAQDTVVVGFSSGELTAMRAENGRTVWSDQLARTGRATAMAALADIDASPVIDRGRVFAIGHGGRMAALDLATGQRLWERNFAGISTPWVAGEFVYLVTLEGELVCLTRAEGKVRWVTQLRRWKNLKKKTGPIVWSGPVLGSEKLVLVSSEKEMVTVDPYEGKLLSSAKLRAAAYLPPVLAGGLLYVLTDDGKLTAWR
jgi:outer membrane protein assembly factor BamB